MARGSRRKVRGHGDDRLGDGLAQVVLGGLLHLHEHARRDFRRRHALALRLDPGIAIVGADHLVGDHLDVALHDVIGKLAADEALHREQGVVRIGDRLAFGRLADDDLIVPRKGYDRGCGAVAFRVLDDARFAAFHDGHARVGRAQVDADDLCHVLNSANSLLGPSRRTLVGALSGNSSPARLRRAPGPR
jgi:hypothetical protein